MINRAVIIGRLTREIELRKTQTGLSVASFTVAVNRPKRKDQVEGEADFINCVAWRGTADYLNDYSQKGTLVGIEGKIQTRNYQNDYGATFYVTEILVDTANILSGGRDKRQENQVNNNLYSQHQNQFQTQETQDFEQFGDGLTVDLSSDDLPF